MIILTSISIIQVIGSKKGLEKSLGLIILSFIYGYRTIELFEEFYFHPSELIILAALINIYIYNHKQITKYPSFLLLILPFCIFYIFIDIVFDVNISYLTVWDALSSFKQFSNIFLVFFIVGFIQINYDYIRSLFHWMIIGTTFICICGFLEF